MRERGEQIDRMESESKEPLCCCHCVGQVLAVTSSNKGSGPLRVFRVETHRDTFILDGSQVS